MRVRKAALVSSEAGRMVQAASPSLKTRDDDDAKFRQLGQGSSACTASEQQLQQQQQQKQKLLQQQEGELKPEMWCRD